ncbi:MAG: hypothetical protein GY811_15005 [Myxococcales bacterium]|nr:hypothetical protein [Myxococcales bacterium]
MTQRLLCIFVFSLGLVLVGGEEGARAEDGSVGLMVDAGLPDGVSGSLVWRATPRIRAHGGMGYNGFAPGVRAGVSLAAFPYFITPTATVEAGRFFQGNANTLAQMVSGDSSFDEPVLREFGYDFANAHLGIELGYSGMTFYVHGGMSALQMRVRNLDETLAASFEDSEGPKLEVRSDPVVRVIAPSARAGFVYYF